MRSPQCAKEGGQWEKVLSLLGEMCGTGIKPDMITYNVAILPYKKSEQRGNPLLVLEEMHGVGIMPGVITYNASVLVCKKSRQ